MSFVRNMLIEQRRRVVGSVLGHLERSVYSKLTPLEQRELREHVLRSVNAYHDVCLDILKASASEDVVVNEEAIRLIGELHEQIVRSPGWPT